MAVALVADRFLEEATHIMQELWASFGILGDFIAKTQGWENVL